MGFTRKKSKDDEVLNNKENVLDSNEKKILDAVNGEINKTIIDNYNKTINLDQKDTMLAQALAMVNLNASLYNNYFTSSDYFENMKINKDENNDIILKDVLRQSSIMNQTTIISELFILLNLSKSLWYDERNDFRNNKAINENIKKIILEDEVKYKNTNDKDRFDYLSMIYDCICNIRPEADDMIGYYRFIEDYNTNDISSNANYNHLNEIVNAIKFIYSIHGYEQSYFIIETDNLLSIIDQLQILIMSYFNNKNQSVQN